MCCVKSLDFLNFIVNEEKIYTQKRCFLSVGLNPEPDFLMSGKFGSGQTCRIKHFRYENPFAIFGDVRKFWMSRREEWSDNSDKALENSFDAL